VDRAAYPMRQGPPWNGCRDANGPFDTSHLEDEGCDPGRGSPSTPEVGEVGGARRLTQKEIDAEPGRCKKGHHAPTQTACQGEDPGTFHP
jgi:hypothetical protein